MSKKQPRNTKGKLFPLPGNSFMNRDTMTPPSMRSLRNPLPQKAPFIIILKEKMLCSDLFPFCLTKNIWNWKHSFPTLRHAMNS